MKIKFSDIPGEIYDVFYSLWFINNYEYAKTRKESFGVYQDNEFEKSLISIAKEDKINLEKTKRFFPKELEPKNLLSFPNLWKFNSISKYLQHIENLDILQLRKVIVNSTQLITEPGEAVLDTDLINKYTSDNLSTINFMEDKDLPSELKWEFFLLLKDKNKYIGEYMDFIRSYLKIYSIIENKRNNIISEFNEELKNNLESRGIDYLHKKINYFYDFRKCKKIYITTSVLSSLIIDDNNPENCFVIMGPSINNVSEYFYGKDNINNSLSTIKSICDNTRFKIIKLLLEKDCYGQEIADSLNLSKSTVSHHIFNLTAANLISVNRESQRNYYSLRIDELTKSIEILIRELNLKI